MGFGTHNIEFSNLAYFVAILILPLSFTAQPADDVKGLLVQSSRPEESGYFGSNRMSIPQNQNQLIEAEVTRDPTQVSSRSIPESSFPGTTPNPQPRANPKIKLATTQNGFPTTSKQTNVGSTKILPMVTPKPTPDIQTPTTTEQSSEPTLITSSPTSLEDIEMTSMAYDLDNSSTQTPFWLRNPSELALGHQGHMNPAPSSSFSFPKPAFLGTIESFRGSSVPLWQVPPGWVFHPIQSNRPSPRVWGEGAKDPEPLGWRPFQTKPLRPIVLGQQPFGPNPLGLGPFGHLPRFLGGVQSAWQPLGSRFMGQPPAGPPFLGSRSVKFLPFGSSFLINPNPMKISYGKKDLFEEYARSKAFLARKEASFDN